MRFVRAAWKFFCYALGIALLLAIAVQLWFYAHVLWWRSNDPASSAFMERRLEALHAGFSAMKADGFPVRCIHPQGAIYLSLQLDVVGRTLHGKVVEGNEAIRKTILEHAGLAVVPFQAFGLMEETGWFRLSIGAVSMDEIESMFPRLRALFAGVSRS